MEWCSLSQAPRSGRRPAEVAVIGSDRRSIGAKLRTKPFALTHAGSQNTAIVAATCRLTAVGLPCFSLQRTSTRGFLSIIIHLLQPGKSWFALLPLQALDLLTYSRSRRFVVAHVRWPSHHRLLNLQYVQSHHLIEYSLAGRPEVTAGCQHGKGGIWGRPWSCPCVRQAGHAPCFHATTER